MNSDGRDVEPTSNGDTVAAGLASPGELVKRLRRLRDSLTSGLVERDLAIRLALLAALSGEHLLLLGPPGTAKSLVARRLRLAIKNGSYFERLLTRFSVPDELFGPLSIAGLQEDRYERLTESYLPTASIAFLDEIFKANSAILNALLTLLNEREFDNGTRRESTPLVAVVGASNELPEGEELHALLDRFLLRLHVAPVTEEGFTALMQLGGENAPEVAADLKLTDEDFRRIQSESEKVTIPEGVLHLISELRQWCFAEKIHVSDRRWRKVAKLLRTSAWTNGRHTVGDWDCWLLQHCMGDHAEDGKKVFDWYESRVGAVATRPDDLIRLVGACERQLKDDRTTERVKVDRQGRKLFTQGDGTETTEERGQKYRDGEPLYLAPENARTDRGDRTNDGEGFTREEVKDLWRRNGYGYRGEDAVTTYTQDQENWLMGPLPPAVELMPHPRVYIEQQVGQLKVLREEAESFQEGLQDQIQSLDHELTNHLWVMPEFVDPAGAQLRSQHEDAGKLVRRVDKIIAGYETLPQREDADADE